jgi:hypothetical protein
MSNLKRVRYFPRQLLTAGDLKAEQDYLLERLRRRNRHLLGAGIVSGLRVSVDRDLIRVEPGMAIDGRGNEIIVESVETLPLPPHCRFQLELRYVERLTDPIPAVGDVAQNHQYSRIEEGYALELRPATAEPEGPVLATGRSGTRGWKIVSGPLLQIQPQPACASGLGALAIFALLVGLLLGRNR